VTATVRPAREADDAALRSLETATWSWMVSPAPAKPADEPFFGAAKRPEDVLVAAVGDAVAGYVMLGPASPLVSNGHVLEIKGLAVDPAHQGRGIGRLLMDAAVNAASVRGARKLTLRVLGPNAIARALYESCGFEVEGIRREEFLLDGRYVDDVVMARRVLAQ